MGGAGILTLKSDGITDNNGVYLISGIGQIPSTASDYINVCIYSYNFDVGESFTLLASKLELGPRQTLAHKDADGNWVLNDPPPDKATELAKCRRYYLGGYLQAVNLNSNMCFLPTPVSMRSVPVIQGSYNVRKVSDKSVVPNATVVVTNRKIENGIALSLSGISEPCYLDFLEGSGLSSEL